MKRIISSVHCFFERQCVDFIRVEHKPKYEQSWFGRCWFRVCSFMEFRVRKLLDRIYKKRGTK